MSTTKAEGDIDTTVDGTFYTIYTFVDAGDYVVKVNLENMEAGDDFRLQVQDKVGENTTAAALLDDYYRNQQALPIKMSIPLPMTKTGQTLRYLQNDGSTFNFDYEIVQIA